MIALTFVITGFVNMNTIARQKELDFRLLSYLAQVTTIAGTVATIAAAWWLRSVWALSRAQEPYVASLPSGDVNAHIVVEPMTRVPVIFFEQGLMQFIHDFGTVIAWATPTIPPSALSDDEVIISMPRSCTMPEVASTSFFNLLHAYVIEHGVREHPELAALRAATASHPRAGMQISPEQGQLLQLLVRTIGAHRTIEIGVFTGYSALAVALALPADGRILACDISDEYTRVARPFWKRAGVDHKIELVLEPAIKTLDARLAAGHGGTCWH